MKKSASSPGSTVSFQSNTFTCSTSQKPGNREGKCPWHKGRHPVIQTNNLKQKAIFTCKVHYGTKNPHH